MLEEKFIVKKIVSTRNTEDGKQKFEVEWETTWESEEHLRTIAPLVFEKFLGKEIEKKKGSLTTKSVDNDRNGSDNTNKESKEEDADMADLFSSSASSPLFGKSKKASGGINAVISRLQKTKKKEMAKQLPEDSVDHDEKSAEGSPLKNRLITENEVSKAASAYFDNERIEHENEERMDFQKKTEETLQPRVRTDSQSDQDGRLSYLAQYPLSPREAVEAKEGGVLPSHASMSPHYAAMSPPQVSPRYVAATPQYQATTPRHHSATSSTSLQSLRANIDNIPKLFPPESVEQRNLESMYLENNPQRSLESMYGENAPQRKHSLQVLPPNMHAVILKCTICSDVFYEDCKFQQHMFMHEQVSFMKQDVPKLLKPGTFQCKFCRTLFDDKEKLRIHYSERHEKEFAYTQPIDQLYKCSLCDMTFVDYNKLLYHHQSHGKREVFILPKKTTDSTSDIASAKCSSTSSNISGFDSRSTGSKTPQTVNIKEEQDDNVFEDNQIKLSADAVMTTLNFQPVNEALMSKTSQSSEGKKMYRCNLCDELFENENERANHSLIHVNRSSSLDCHICGKQFKHRTNLSTHLVVHSGVKPHQCHVCLRRFTQKVNLQRHMHIHDGSRPFTCKFCSKSFTQRANLQRHILSHTEHPKEMLLIALNEIPNESEVNNAITESLTEAMSVITDSKNNNDKPEFRCDICDKLFAQKVNLQKHLLIHSGSRPFQCYVCGKAFRQRASLQKHYTVHTNGSTSFICQTCNRLFVSRTNLQRHMLVHAMPGINQCYLCDQKFTTSDNLERHFSEHIEEATPNISLPQKYFEQSTPGQTFRCATCDIVFDSPIIFSQHLQCHQRGFSPDSTPNDIGDITKAYEENQACPLQCNACGVIFMSVAKLEAHMVTHAENNPVSSGSKHAIGVMISSDPSVASQVLIPKYISSKSTGSATMVVATAPSVSEQGLTIKQEERSATKSSSVSRVSRCPVCKDMFTSKAEMREHYSKTHLEKTAPLPVSSAAGVVYQADGYQYVTTTSTPPIKFEAADHEVGDGVITESEELLIKENEQFIKDNILGGSKEYESKGRYERGNYSCKICNRVLTYKYSLEKHMLLHTGSFPYKCNLCSKRFNHKVSLDKHLLMHTGEKPYSCQICQRPFGQKSNLQRHQLTHTQNRDFICEVCGKRFNHMASLKTHSLIHTGAKPFSCYVCGKRFNQKGNLKRHIQTHRSGKRNKVTGLESGDKTEKCEEVLKYEEMNEFENMMDDDEEYGDEDDVKLEEDVENDSHSRRSSRSKTKKTMADYEFYEDEALPTMIVGDDDQINKSHDSLSQSPHNSFSASEDQKSSNRASMTSYGDISDEDDILTVVPSDAIEESPVTMATDQTNNEIVGDRTDAFHCDSCSKLFLSVSSLEAHKRSAHSILCNICGKKFSQKANLLKHKLIHANKKPFECKVCHKAFRQKANLQRHELIHDKDRKVVNCTVCQKGFRCTWSLKQHMKNHANETGAFGCSICGKTFREKNDLEKHFEVHANLLTFSCRLCEEKFFNKDNLLKHVQSHSDATPALLKEIENDTGSEIQVVVNGDEIETYIVSNNNNNNNNNSKKEIESDNESEMLVVVNGESTETVMVTNDNDNGILMIANENNEIKVQ